MKVFKYDIATGKRGEQVADIPRPDHTGASLNDPTIKVPSNTLTADWTVINKAENRRGEPIVFPFPVCFCTGEWFAGDGSYRPANAKGVWIWHILVSQ